jgi:mannose-6-phosphate isomerase
VSIGLHLLENSVQEYAWGSRTAIPELLDLPSPADRPQAELWMGAHPRAPSHVVVDGRRERLDELIERFPEEVLGARVASRFGGRLPFLLKVLAAEEPLSIQAHPTAEQARIGFARENAAGVPLDAPARTYRDSSHKPEVLAALSRMWALHGFRAVADAAGLMRRLGVPLLEPLVEALEGSGPRGLLSCVLTMEPAGLARVIRAALDAAPLRVGGAESDWMARLASRYPGDAGVLAPLFLNLVRLEPGQAVYLAAGELHAYLHGTGVELMANSDNVLRGGLTPKHVDVAELLRTLTFRTGGGEPLLPRALPSGEAVFDTPAEEFRLSRITLSTARSFRCDVPPRDRGVEILLVTEGAAEVDAPRAGRRLALRRGQSCLVAAAAGPWGLAGAGTICRASVP